MSGLEQRAIFLKDGVLFKNLQTRVSRGRRSRNKASVGEPTEGSLASINILFKKLYFFVFKFVNNFKKFINPKTRHGSTK